MTRFIYLAYPIDSVRPEEASQLQSEVTDARNFIINMEDTVLYDPGRAFGIGSEAQPDYRISKVNQAALVQSDGVLAILPPHISSVGVPFEIMSARAMNIPAFVVRSKPSWALQAAGLLQFETVRLALEALATVPKREPSQRPHVKYKPEHHIDGIDPAPRRAYDDDAGYDLVYYGEDPVVVAPGQSADIPAGVTIEWPPGTWGLLVGRSSSFRHRGILVNTSVIDPGFRGSLFAIVRNISETTVNIQPGERVAQIVPLPALAPKLDMVWSDNLTPTDRGENGFGSSGL